LNGRVQTQVEELPDNKVRLRVEVPGADVHHAVEHAASDLAASVKIPGFRKGKVPMPVLVQRIGRERIMAEAIDSHISGWFWNAAAGTRVRPVEQPQYDFELPASDRDDWHFTATVVVQAKPELADWTTLQAPRREVEVPEELVQQELDELRSMSAALAPVDARPVREGDTVVVDLVSPGGEARRDLVLEIGRSAIVEEIETGLVGMSPGDTKDIAFELADETSQTVSVTVKEVKEKVLPPLDDELARAASEFDTFDELKADVEDRIREQLQAESEAAFRAAAVDALVAASRVDASGPLVEARTRELVGGLQRQLERRGIGLESYLAMTGTSAEELVGRLRGEAEQSVARELVLEAAADQLEIDISDGEVETVIREQAGAIGDDPDEAVTQVRESGRFDTLREDLRLRAAVDRIAAEVEPISPDLAAARDKLWTPDKEKEPADTKLWTPGSKERA
jgi:trigger factor